MPVRVTVTTPDKYWATIQHKLKKTIAEGIQDVARLACTKAANSTFPKGTSAKTKDMLEKAIYKDINRAYIAIDEHPKQLHEDGSYLLRHRGSRGRVPEGLERKFIQRVDYEHIVDKLVKRAGLAKAGYLDAAKKLKGNSRVPVWLRKEQDLSDVRITSGSVTITNRVKYASYLITDRQLENLMKNAYDGLIKQAEKIKLD